MNILVTGGGGFLGQAIVHRLVQRGDRVRVINRGHYPGLEALGVECHRGDIADSRAVDAAVAGMDAVIHVAARAGPGLRYQSFHRANVRGTEHVIDACRRHGIGYLVYTSSPSVAHAGGDLAGVDESLPYADHYAAPYPETKALAEQQVLKAHGDSLKTCALRPHLIWGPGDNQLLPRLVARAKRRALPLPAPDKLIDTTYIDNAAEAHVLALDELRGQGRCAGKAYFISNGEPKPVAEIIAALLTAAGVTPRFRRINPRLAMAVATVVEGIWRLLRLDADPPLSRFVVEHLSTAHWYKLDAARDDFGYVPSVSIAEGLERLRACELGARGGV